MKAEASLAAPSRVYRPPGGREELSSGRVKGGMVRSHLQWVRDHHESDLKALLESLSAASARELSQPVLASSWYRFATLIELDRACAQRFGKDHPEELIRDLGRYSARINLTTTYRVFNREDLHEFFANGAMLHTQFQDFGQARYERTGPSTGSIHYSNYTAYSPVYCESALGFFDSAILIQGASTSSVIEAVCQCHGASECRFEVTWA
jgi:hypothetical protein